MKYTHLFWDFNGTIFSDMQAGIDAVNRMLGDRGLPIIADMEAYREIFDFPIKEYYRKLGFDFDKEPYEVLAPIWVELYLENCCSAGIVDGVDTVVKAVAKTETKQVILSACEKNMLCDQLAELGVIEYFDEIIGLDDIHAAGKLHLAREWRDKNPEAKILFVGDTTHDAETAEVLGADCLLFTGGHQSKERLLTTGCETIDGIVEILDHIK
ncbi:MAG: HAD family hydrolase [Ruminococcaceae bacterium]|nr:HAD family hydrolase [Oscillospiraceae bacterium]